MDRDQALALLQWYELSGVDEAIDDVAHDRFSEAVSPPLKSILPRAPSVLLPHSPSHDASGTTEGKRSASANAQANVPPTHTSLAAIPSEPYVEPSLAARELASSARNLAELEKAVRNFAGCSLKSTAKNTCFCDGNPSSRIMFIGEGPGRDEDIQGKPFVGRAGQLFDRMLAAIGLDRTNVYITNIVYWRPPGNRTPTPEETASCRPFTERQIELVNPDILVFLGGASAKHLLSTNQGITRLRGTWKSFLLGNREYPAMPTLHPAYLLRQTAQKRLAWTDFLQIKRALDSTDTNNMGKPT
jgi:uracil-DNA glycosylase family 4